MDSRESAKRNDLFRKTVPMARVVYPENIDMYSPILARLHELLEFIMDIEIPLEKYGAHDRGSVTVPGGAVVEWEIRERCEEEHARSEGEGYYCIWHCTDLFGARQKAGVPWGLSELESIYETHELLIRIPG